MLSETGSKHVEKIHCKMVQTSISAELCSAEQGTSECAGCSASTRRCSVCSKLRGITDPVKGICSHCVEKSEKRHLKGDFSDKVSDHLSERPLDRVRRLGELQFVVDEGEAGQKSARSQAKPTLVSRGAESVYALLIEHRQQKGGVWLVLAPLTVLKRRLHLTQEEALQILKQLVDLEMIKGDEHWEKGILLKCEIFGNQEPDYTAYTRRRDLRSQTESIGVRTKASANKVASTAAKRTRTINPARSESDRALPVQSISSAEPVTVRRGSVPSHYYRDLYDYIVSRSSLFKDERLVGGAIPMLQIRFKLSAVQAKQALSWFEENGHLRQKDQWRTVVLVSSTILSEEGLMSGRLPKPAQRDNPSVSPKVKEHPSAVEEAFPSTLNDIILEIETALVSLRKKRDDIGTQVAQLEESLMLIKTCCHRLNEDERIDDASLKEVVRAVQKLFSSMRR